MITSKLQRRKSGQTRFFPEIAISCSRELQNLGFSADVFLIPGGLGVRFLSDRQFSNLSSLSHLPIKELDFCKVFSLEPEYIQSFSLEALSLPRGCNFPFREFKRFKLKRLSAIQSKSTDFESLAILPIEELNLSGCSIQNLSFTHSMPLTRLDLSGTNILDLRPLSEKPLEKLFLQNSKVENLSPLADCPLEELNLNKTLISDLAPLRGSPLRYLELRKTEVNDLSPLMESPLENLTLPGSPIFSIAPLTYCPLKNLNLIGLDLDDLSPLKEMQLASLSISPLELDEEDFLLLNEINASYLIGPGDDPKQTVKQFMDKYSNHEDQ